MRGWSTVVPLHLGALHPVEQALTLLLAFGPFLALGLVIAVRRRSDARAEEEAPADVQPDAAAGRPAGRPAWGPARGSAREVVDPDPVLGPEGLEQQVADEALQLAADQRDADLDGQLDRLDGRWRPPRPATVVPDMVPGLPGMETVMSPCVGLDQCSSWTMLVSSPTIFLANDGMPRVGCTWSMRTSMVSP